MKILIRLLLQKQSDLGLDCLWQSDLGLHCLWQSDLGFHCLWQSDLGLHCLSIAFLAGNQCFTIRNFRTLLYCLFHYLGTGPGSAVGNVSGYRCVSDCRSRGREFDPGPVPYFRGD